MRPNPGGPGRNADAGGLAIIAALRSEARLLDRAAPDGCRVLRSGPGANAARIAAEQAVAAGAGRLMSWGVAGGLTAAAKTGTLVIPQRIVTADGPALAAAPEWRARLAALLRGSVTVLEGDLAGVDSVLTSSAAKALLGRSLGAVAADMESHAIAVVAARAGLPFAAIRVVIDTVDDDLPVDIETYVDPSGNARPWRALGSLLRSPGKLGAVIDLGRKSARAHTVLGDAAECLGAEGFGVGSGDGV